MAIQVTCPGCHTRFSVADQHAGKEGPCPKCKKKITIPNLEDEVVIHAAESDGPTDSKGRSVLKTKRKKDAGFDPLIATGVAVTMLSTLIVSYMLRGQVDSNDWALPLLAGATLLGPLVAWAGYAFLRDQELGAYQGFSLWGRASICGVVYALAWCLYCYIAGQIGGEDWLTEGLEIWQVAFAGAVALGLGSFVGIVALDMEPIMAALLCVLFFIVTIVLRVVMALPPLPGFLGDS